MSNLTFANEKSTLMDILSNPKKFADALTELENAIAAHDKVKAEALAAVELTAPAQEIPALHEAAKLKLAQADEILAKAKEEAVSIKEHASRQANQKVDEAIVLVDDLEEKRKRLSDEIVAMRQQAEDDVTTAQRLLAQNEQIQSALQQRELELAAKEAAAQAAQESYSVRKQELENKIQQFLSSLRE